MCVKGRPKYFASPPRGQLVTATEPVSYNSSSHRHQILFFPIHQSSQSSHQYTIHSIGMSFTRSSNTDALTQICGPFSGEGDFVRLEKDPQQPMTFSGSVLHKGSGYRSHTTVVRRKPFYESGQPSPSLLPVQSLDVRFPASTRITAVDEKPLFLGEDQGSYELGIPTRSATGTVDCLYNHQGRQIGQAPRNEEFEVRQKLYLDPALAASYGFGQSSRHPMDHVSGLSAYFARRAYNSRRHESRAFH